MRTVFWFLLLSLAVPASAANNNELASLVARRLSYMNDVAAYKWLHKLPIEDAVREQIVLQAAIETGLRYALPPQHTGDFFRLQMAAAKDIQQYWFEQWRTGHQTPPIAAPKLASTIRPLLDSLGVAIMAQLGQGPTDFSAIAIEGLGNAHIEQMEAAANAILPYADRLLQITDSGVLRIGTTGDYPPFSSDGQGAELEGVDIDLGKNLAAYLGVKVLWVETSWPSLMQDLHAGQFDIGMSGISFTAARATQAFFSLPYHSGGKTPIARCEDAAQFDSLAAIDRADVTVIVNPGGTNEQFVRSNIKRAEILLHADNRTIFAELLSGAADVMFTDQIEVAIQTAKQPQLCATMPGQVLTKENKAYLLPQDETLRTAVNEWLQQRLAQGVVEASFARHTSGQ